MEKQKMYSEKLHGAVERIYYFDLNLASNGSCYLSLGERSKDKEGNPHNNRLMIFQDDVEHFKATLDRLIDRFREEVSKGQVPESTEANS